MQNGNGNRSEKTGLHSEQIEQKESLLICRKTGAKKEQGTSRDRKQKKNREAEMYDVLWSHMHPKYLFPDIQRLTPMKNTRPVAYDVGFQSPGFEAVLAGCSDMC